MESNKQAVTNLLNHENTKKMKGTKLKKAKVRDKWIVLSGVTTLLAEMNRQRIKKRTDTLPVLFYNTHEVN